MFTKKENSQNFSHLDSSSADLEAGFFEWNIQEDGIILSPYFAEKLSFKTISTIQSYSAWTKLIHPENVKYFKDSFEKSLTKEKPYISLECRQLGRDKKWYWFNICGKVIRFNSEGNPVHVAGTCIDITKYKEDMVNIFQTKLLISEINHIKNSKKDNDSLLPICTEALKSFNKLARSSSSILLLSTPESLSTDVKNQLPISSDDSKSLNSEEWFEERKEFIKNFPVTKSSLIQNNEKTSLLGIHFNLPYNHHGTLISERNEPFAEDVLEFLGPLIEAINNIISLKKLEEKGKELDSFIEFFIKQVPAPVAMFDADMRHKFVSEAWRQDNDLGADHEFINKTYYEIYPEETTIWKENHQKVLKGETITWGPTQDITRSGEIYWTEGVMLPWYTLDGTLGGLFMYYANITKLIEQETILRNALEDLSQVNQAFKQSNESLESFAYVCSHDLKEPLRTVTNYIQLIFNKHAQHFDDESIMYVRHCLKGISNINTLIQDILSYSKIIGQKELPKDFLDLNSVAQEIKEDFGYRLAEINGHLKIINLPIIKAVRVQIHQLFLNLIGNSIKFRSEKPLLIEIFGLESDIFWEVRVRDNGIGIDKEYHNSVFEPFKRLNSKHTYEGSGVGLSICKRIVEGHGGTIMVQSNPTGGCEFVIKIPK